MQTGQDINDKNMFAYCGDDPVNKSDPDGTHWYFLWLDDLFKFGSHKPAPKKSTGSLVSLFNAAVNTATNITAAKSGNPAAAKAVGNTVKMGNGHTSPKLQKATNAFSKYDFTTDMTVGISTRLKGLGVQIGGTKIMSPQKGITSTYCHAGANYGYSPFPVNLTYSIGIVSNYTLPSDYNGFAYSINANALYGGAYSSWFTTDVKTHLFSVSSSPGGSVGIDYYWDVSNK